MHKSFDQENLFRSRRLWSSLHRLGWIGAISQVTLNLDHSLRGSSRTYQIIRDRTCACCGGA